MKGSEVLITPVRYRLAADGKLEHAVQHSFTASPGPNYSFTCYRRPLFASVSGLFTGIMATRRLPRVAADGFSPRAVNAPDLNDLGQNWLEHPNTWQLGDFTADGIVNAGDLNKLGLNWLESIPSAASPESVPEPSAFTLLLLGIMATPLLRHRRRAGRLSNV